MCAHPRPLAERRARGQGAALGCLGRALLELWQLSLLLAEAPALVMLPLAVVCGRVERSARMACMGPDCPGQLARRSVRVSHKQRGSQ